MKSLIQHSRLLLPLPSVLLVGLSGGADSVALLRLLLALREEEELSISAIHVNHHLRGDESDADEAFCTALCAEHKVPILLKHASPPEHPSENWARSVRYAFFHEAMDATNADALVLAHQRDDQAETMLLHLLRGCGLDGLRAMRREAVLDGMRVIRPLLDFTHAELTEILTDLGQAWREDSSNAAHDFLRNRVRHELLPMMESLSPGVRNRLAITAGLLEKDACFLNRVAEDALQSLPHRADWISLSALKALDPAIQSRLLRCWWQSDKDTLSRRQSLNQPQTDMLLNLLSRNAGASCSLPGGLTAWRGWRCLHLISPDMPEVHEPAPFQGKDLSLCGITMSVQPSVGSPGDGKRCQEVPKEWLKGAVLRTRQQGDMIRPFGLSGRQSLQDYLVNRKVDAPFRDRIPLLCRGSEVLMVAGTGVGSVPAYNSAEENVRLQWHGEMPWLDESVIG